MKRKSDKRPSERRVSATEASRTFSSLLDQIESGARFLVQRRGRDVCIMAPPPVAGRRASECLTYLLGRSPVLLDDRFSDDLRDILKGEPIEEQPSWDS